MGTCTGDGYLTDPATYTTWTTLTIIPPGITGITLIIIITCEGKVIIIQNIHIPLLLYYYIFVKLWIYKPTGNS